MARQGLLDVYILYAGILSFGEFTHIIESAMRRFESSKRSADALVLGATLALGVALRALAILSI
jgi:hypothetical protein